MGCENLCKKQEGPLGDGDLVPSGNDKVELGKQPWGIHTDESENHYAE